MINVLIVEDDPMVAEVARSYLHDVPGFQLVAIANGVEQAKKTLSKHPEVKLVLLDVYMLGENGLELLPYLRKNKIEVDVILMTAASDKDSIHQALRYGAIDYILKPYQFDRFKESLLAYQNQHSFWNEGESANQSQIDQAFFKKQSSQTAKQTLPKGLTRETLQDVWNAIQHVNQSSFSTEDVVLHTNISRVSVKKYLTFLLELEVLKIQPTYGSIGRPIHIYKLVYENKRKVTQYIQ